MRLISLMTIFTALIFTLSGCGNGDYDRGRSNKSTNGTGKIFDNLLREWGIAVLLSDTESPTDLPTYNTGDFTLTNYNGIGYNLGSINFFNYSPEPTTHSSAGTIKPQENYYYKVDSNLIGDVDINLDLWIVILKQL